MENNQTRKKVVRKKRIRRVLLALVVLTGLSFGAVWGVYAFFDSVFSSNDQNVNKSELADNMDDLRSTIEKDKGYSIEMGYETLLEIMNQMSHQKVIASAKWGAIEMSEKNIDTLLYIIEENVYINEDVLKGILDKWKAGDFSEIVEDHNTVWELQGGTIGKATGTMTPEEEQAFIEETFRK